MVGNLYFFNWNILVVVVVILGYCCWGDFCHLPLVLIAMHLPYLMMCILCFSIIHLDQFPFQVSVCLDACVCFALKENQQLNCQ